MTYITIFIEKKCTKCSSYFASARFPSGRLHKVQHFFDAAHSPSNPSHKMQPIPRFNPTPFTVAQSAAGSSIRPDFRPHRCTKCRRRCIEEYRPKRAGPTTIDNDLQKLPVPGKRRRKSPLGRGTCAFLGFTARANHATFCTVPTLKVHRDAPDLPAFYFGLPQRLGPVHLQRQTGGNPGQEARRNENNPRGGIPKPRFVSQRSSVKRQRPARSRGERSGSDGRR